MAGHPGDIECEASGVSEGDDRTDPVKPAPTVTWWGHSTVLVDDGARVLTDPLLGQRLAHLVRRTGLCPAVATLSPDIVVISHLHADHCHLPSLRALPRGTRLAVPRGGGRLVARTGCAVQEVAEGDALLVGTTRIRVVRADHDGRRWPRSRTSAPALGYVIEGSATTWFAGDTSWFEQMATLFAGRVDLALLPIGGWGPSLGAGHLDPSQAVDVLELVRPRAVLPIHYGTFWPLGLSRVRPHLFNDPGRVFAQEARRRTPDVEVRLLAPASSSYRSLTTPAGRASPAPGLP